MPDLSTLAAIVTSANDALDAEDRRDQAAKDAAFANAFKQIEALQTVASTRATIQKTAQSRDLFPGVQKLQKESVAQAGQKTALGGIEVRGAERGEAADIAFDAAMEELLQKEDKTSADFKAILALQTGKETLQKAKTGAAVAKTQEQVEIEAQAIGEPKAAATGRLAEQTARPDIAGAAAAEARTVLATEAQATEARRKKLTASVVLDDLQETIAQALIDAGQPEEAAKTQVAILKLQPELTQSLIDLNIAKAGGAKTNELRQAALASGWTEDQFNRWIVTSEQIKRAQPLLTIRQQIFKLLSDVQTSTGDQFQQMVAQLARPGSPVAVPAGADKATAMRLLREQLKATDDLIAAQIPEWPRIANRATILSTPETGAGGLRREEGRTARPQTTPAQQRRLTQDEIRQRALEFNTPQGQ